MKKMVMNNDVLFGSAIALLKEGKKVTIPVKGYSMLPFIVGEKDLVVLEEVKDEIKKDDIVLFKISGKYILHRVLAVNDGIATIQGDGVLLNKEICPVENIYGRVTTILKKGKREVDPYSESMLKKVHAWQNLGMKRRYPLAILRRLPGIKSRTI